MDTRGFGQSTITGWQESIVLETYWISTIARSGVTTTSNCDAGVRAYTKASGSLNIPMEQSTRITLTVIGYVSGL